MSGSVDVGLEVRSADPSLRDAVFAALAFNGYDRLIGISPTAITIEAEGGRVPDPPARKPDFSLAEGISVFTDELSVCFHAPECQARLPLDAALISITVPDAGRPRADLLVYAIVPVMARFGYFGLHAAAVADGDRGFLFMADSGGGKTTSALLTVVAGWDFISDDFVYIRRDGSGAHHALGLRRTICLRDDAESHFPELTAMSSRRHIDHKFRLPSDEAFPGRVRDGCRPDTIVVPRVTGGPTTSIEPISRSEVLAEAMRQSGPFLVDRRTVPAQMATLRDLIAGCACVRLLAGTDILGDPEILTGILSEIASS